MHHAGTLVAARGNGSSGLCKASSDEANVEIERTRFADLDRLVTQALIPERARTRSARDQTDAANALRTEWETLKSQWKGGQ